MCKGRIGGQEVSQYVKRERILLLLAASSLHRLSPLKHHDSAEERNERMLNRLTHCALSCAR
jgi:hypothetical protein